MNIDQSAVMVTEIGQVGIYVVQDRRNAMISTDGIIYREGLVIIDMDTSQIAANEFIEEIALILMDNRIDFHINFHPKDSELESFIRKCPKKIETEFKKTIN